jgi:hypothetical protein
MVKQRVIFVHGMSNHLLGGKDKKPTYYLGLRDALISRLKTLGVVPADAPNDDEIPGVISFDSVDYSDVGQVEEEAVLQVYRDARAGLFNFLDNMVEHALDGVRLQLVTAFSDVLVYRSQYWTAEIRGRLLAKINPHLGENEAITIIAHSLGSAVAFDTVYNNANTSAWQDARFKPANLFIMGSPLALFAMEPMPETTERAAALDEGAVVEEDAAPPLPWQGVLQESIGVLVEWALELTPAPFPGGMDPRLDILSPTGVLYNFLDAQDLLAYPVQAFFKDKVAYEVKDIAVGNGLNPITAHSDYWDNHEVADTIAAQLKKEADRQP